MSDKDHMPSFHVPMVIKSKTEQVLEEIAGERFRQQRPESDGGAGFSTEHDARLALTTWVAIACRHLGLATMDGGLTSRRIFRKQMIRLGAVAAAAVEALDAQMAEVEDPLVQGFSDDAVKQGVPQHDAKLRQMAQRLANEFHEPVYVLPPGWTRTDSGGSVVVEALGCCVLGSHSTAEERKQAVLVINPSGPKTKVVL
jgi:hypothetical protein